MGDVDFDTEEVTITGQTINDDELRLTIDWPIKVIFIGATITKHFSDDTTETLPVQLTLNDTDFDDALAILFPESTEATALENCKSGIIQLCRQHKSELQ